MLTLYDSARLGRRNFLRIGSLALGGLALPNLLRAAQGGESLATGKSVIFLFLHGGPSQQETWDPKMTAPDGVRSATGETPTRLPGVTFGGTFPKLARRADRLAVVRSFTTGSGAHDIKPIVHADTLDANLGSLYSRVVGANDPSSGMPTNVALFPRAVDPDAQKANMNFGKFNATGSLGSGYAPFIPGAGGNLQEDMQLRLPMDRLEDRRSLLAGLDSLKQELDASGNLAAVDRLRQQALSTILGGVADAFNLSKEDPRTVARYDTAPLVRPDQISRRWNNYNNYVDNARSLGKLLLLARRLCERGAGFVTVTTNFVWDMHADQNNVGVQEGMQYLGGPLDHALAALLDDLQERGLSDDVLVVACGEMGRTPKINNRGGRDHWGRLAPLLLSGGGLNMGQVIGQSSRDAGEPATTPYTIPHLVATLMHTLLDLGQVRLTRGLPRDLLRVMTEQAPIGELV